MDLFNQLIKNSEYWIRFELGLVDLEDEDYFNEIHYRALTIFNYVFDKNDEVLLVNTISNQIDYNNLDLPKIERFLKDRKLVNNLKILTVPFEYDESDADFKTKRYSLSVRKSDLKSNYIIKAISNKEFGRKPRINGNLYLVNTTRNILFHMYDDRGCDVYGLDKETLLPVYDKFRKWILDYNRIQIDSKFEKGLFNIKESDEEKNLRFKTNQKKVRETQINLFEVNTCHITHEIKLPKENTNTCFEELNQTGFKVVIENQNDNFPVLKITKTEALALIDYQTELMSLYSKKYKGEYKGWSVEKAF